MDWKPGKFKSLYQPSTDPTYPYLGILRPATMDDWPTYPLTCSLASIADPVMSEKEWSAKPKGPKKSDPKLVDWKVPARNTEMTRKELREKLRAKKEARSPKF